MAMLARSSSFPGFFHLGGRFLSCSRYLFSSSSTNRRSPRPRFQRRRELPAAKQRSDAAESPVSDQFRYDNDAFPSENPLCLDDPSSHVKQICSLLSTTPADRTRNLDNLLKDFKKEVTPDLVLRVLMSYRHLGRRNTLEFFSWAGLHLAYKFDDTIVEYMADFLGRRKLFDDMKWLLKTAASQNGRVSCRTVSICIRFLGRRGRVAEALCLFQEMESALNCVPDNLVFNNMLYVLCKRETSTKSIDVAVTIFRRIEAPDAYSYSNLIVGFCKCGRIKDALNIFYEMSRAGLIPSRTAVNNLIGGLCQLSKKQGHIERVRVGNSYRACNILVPNVSPTCMIEPAKEVFWAVTRLGLLPSAFVTTLLITELCQWRRIDEAIEVLKVVEERKVGTLDECYTVLIKVLCEVLRMDEAGKLFSRMISMGSKPKLVVYNSLICSLCKVGNVVAAEKYFKIMTRTRCSPDRMTYTTLIHAYCGDKKLEVAYDMLMEMLGLGCLPHFHTYSMVHSLMKEQGQLDLSVKLESKMETQVIHKYCKEGRLEAAYEMLCSMVERRLHLPIYTKHIIERAFQKSGKWSLAQDLLEKMDQGVQ